MENRDDQKNENKLLQVLKHAVENTNEAFVTIDENHKVLFFNEAAENLFGFSREEVVGNDLDIILTPNCSEKHHEAVANYMATGKARRIGHETEMQVARKNGDSFPASISFSVTRLDGKYYFTAIVKDLTETHMLREKIMRSDRLAALGQLAAEITHEIKNPLMMIGGFANQLSRVIGNEKHLKKLNIIIAEVKRLEDLLADLRVLHQLKKDAAEPVDIKELLEEIFSMVKEDCEEKNIKIELDTGKKALHVEGDMNRLKQVFLNLAKNSIEAIENAGHLSIRAAESGDHVEIIVADDGPGIPDKDKEKIFSCFFTTKTQGTGLGLCISERIIKEHEGSTFTVKSETGKGASFKITMPLYREEK